MSHAVGAKSTEMIQQLAALKADVNARGSDGATALMVAVGAREGALVKSLCAAGGKIEAKDKVGGGWRLWVLWKTLGLVNRSGRYPRGRP